MFVTEDTMIVNKAHTILLFLLAATFTCAAQTPLVLERQVDAKLKEYDFAAAQDLYRRAFDASSDAAFSKV